MSLDEFCAAEFRVANSYKKSDWLETSRCFEHTVLIWIPFLFLFLFTPYQLYCFSKSRKHALPFRLLLCMKLAIGITLVIVTGIMWGRMLHLKVTSEVHIADSDFVAPLLLFLAMMDLLILQFLCRHSGIITSGTLCLSLLIFALCGGFEFAHLIHAYNTPDLGDHVYSIVYLLYYPLILVQLLLSFWADSYYTFDCIDKDREPCPENFASFPNKLMYSWFTGRAVLGWRRPLTASDLWALEDNLLSATVVPLWEADWNVKLREHFKSRSVESGRSYSVDFKEKEVRVISKSSTGGMIKPPSLRSTLFRHWQWSAIYGILLKIAADIIQFSNPQILRFLIAFVETPNQPVWSGVAYAILLLLATMLYTVLTHLNFHHMVRLGIQVRAALTSALFTKSLRLSNAARRDSTLGEMVNLMSVDVQRVTEVLLYIGMVLSSPIQVILAVYFLYNVVGPSVFSGVIFLLLLIPLNMWITSVQRRLQTRQMIMKDERMKLSNEILNGMRVLKLYAWEEPFEQEIGKMRNSELSQLKKLAYSRAMTSFLWTSAPTLVSIAYYHSIFMIVVIIFATYVLSDPNNILDPQTAFVSLSLMNLLRFPMSIIPMLISFIIQANVSLTRIEKFLLNEESSLGAVNRSPHQEESVLITGGNFAWSSDAEGPTLTDINFYVNPGELVAVVGGVGSGKTSLLAAILGEMETISGHISVKGSIAYVPQQAWIQNLTVKENILFSKYYCSDLYNKTLKNCALLQDLKLFSAGDMAEIGEKGATLSGGQRQRISLARAVYQNADIYLLDDPLSAVDSHVGQHIFENVIGNNGMLKDKTRIFVTHGLGYLKKVDRIAVISNGKISETGSYAQLLASSGAFSELIRMYIEESVNEPESIADEAVLEEVLRDVEVVDANLFRRLSSVRLSAKKTQDPHSENEMAVSRHNSIDQKTEEDKSVSLENNEDEGKSAGKLIGEEMAATGGVKPKVYLDYMKTIGLLAMSALSFFYLGSAAFNIGSSFWLADWSNEATNGLNETVPYEVRLGVYSATAILQGVFILFGTMILSYSMVISGQRIHDALFHRLMRSPMSFYDTTPIGRILNRLGKDIDVIDNTLPITARTWIVSVLNVLSVLIVILVSIPWFIVVFAPVAIINFLFQRIYIWTSRQLKRIESVTRSPVFTHFQETLQGISVIRAYDAQERFIRESERRLDENQISYYENQVSNRWIAIRLEALGNLLVFAASLFAVFGKNTLSPGLVGLAVSYALQMTQTLNYFVRMTSEFESNIVSVERANEYTTIEQEAAWETANEPSKEWPETGAVDFDEYSMRYREDLDLCLKGITCSIQGGEKIGIVGRTGAGKSSLTQGLFRIIEPASGRILIDNVDIAIIGLQKLRSRLTIIPQEPVLFVGTLRMNLDPRNEYSDEQIWSALEGAHLKQYISNLPGKLQHPVAEGGSNLSVGQRQLMCLARALLRKTRVLILDEATAAVDIATDELIQKTIRAHFSDCTVLTIAHRLNTIIESDRVLVLDAGRIAEFDPPQTLLQNQSTIFYSMAKEAKLI